MPAGTLDVSFHDAEHATMVFTAGTLTRTVALQRQVFRNRAVAPALDRTDLYYNASESGWGLTVSHQADIMFLTWYVYDDAGRPAWYVASACAVNAQGNGCSGTLLSRHRTGAGCDLRSRARPRDRGGRGHARVPDGR